MGVSIAPMVDYEEGAVARDSLMVNKAQTIMPPIGGGAAPTTGVERMTVTETSLSLLVNDVRESINKIESMAKGQGGYMVSSNLNTPEGAQTGRIEIRVPTEKRAEAMESLRGMAVKVVSENVLGSDVTDQYVDLQGRIDNLEKTKAKLTSILEKAVAINDILNAQQQVDNLQSQIDSYKGQQMYLEQTAKLTRIAVDLSTDELALPYAPSEAWRPAVIFKTAVRSLVESARGLGNAVIWIAVYTPIWGSVALIIWLVSRRRNG